jgi:hypothetical protein
MTVVMAIACSAPQSWGYDESWPLIFDWTVSVEWAGDTSGLATKTMPNGYHADIDAITPLPKPSYYSMMKEDPKFQTLYEELHAQQRPMGFLLGSDTSPLYGLRDPATLSYVLDQFEANGHTLDFVFVEYEPQFDPNKIQETQATVSMVRNHASALVNQAKVGEYDIFRTSNMRWMPFPAQNNQENIDRLNNLYTGSGLNVAMPSLYPYEYYEVHAGSFHWPSAAERSPNKRSALFWAPLEMLSNAKMNLPSGHWLIPYLADFVPVSGYDAAPPPHEDNAALAQHVRLRGADGYYTFRTMSETEAQPYDNEQYKADVYAAWSELDWLFDGIQSAPTILNLATNKQFGIEWSGVATDKGVAILVSNLGNTATTFTIPSITGHPQYDALLPDQIELPAGTHQMVFVQVPEPVCGAWVLAIGFFLTQRRMFS